MTELDFLKWIMGLISAAIVGLIKVIWSLPEKYVLKEDFNNRMNSVDKKLDTIQTDIKQILKEKK
ncbi:MAG: hypothetical protein GY804_06745 [Alphaproteobacteria bacterium]|nr:hypothetical protein [Alphaproteobacteria bacterium]